MATSEDVRVWRPWPAHEIIALAGRTSSYSFHPVDEYVIGVVTEAPMNVRRGRVRTVVEPDDMCVWDPYVAHSGWAAGDARAWRARLLIIAASTVTELLGLGAEPSPNLVGPLSNPAHVTRRFGALHDLLTSDTPPDALTLETGLVECLRDVFVDPAARRDAGRNRSEAVAAQTILMDRITENITLAELAAAVGLDRFTLLRSFESVFGLPPHRYRIARRLELARRKLEVGEHVAAIATECGFFDQSHLHRLFRRHLGMSPTAYTNAFRVPST